MNSYFVYIMTNVRRSVLYTGVTNDIHRRVAEHQQKISDGFTRKYNVTNLVYVEEAGEITDAIQREKTIKGWTRKKKIELIESINPTWKDLGK